MEPRELSTRQISEDTNEILRQGVAEIELINLGKVPVNYDLNPNTHLDFDGNQNRGGAEMVSIMDTVIGHPDAADADVILLHVREYLRVRYRNTQGWNQAYGMEWWDREGQGATGKRFVFITDAFEDTPLLLAHEVLHELGLEYHTDSRNTNVMTCYINDARPFIGFFGVEAWGGEDCAPLPNTPPVRQWDTIMR